MKNIPKVSVIIPVYNVERYIEQCLRSVQNQTMKELEIIVVNDATTDDSMRIVKQLQAEDSRIYVMEHVDNKGLSYSRNTGIERATGESIYFLDADDWIEKTTLEVAYEVLKKFKPQFVEFGYNRVLDTKTITFSIVDKLELIDDRVLWLKTLGETPLREVMWNKLFDTDFIKKNKFSFDTESRVNEDFLFCLQIYNKIERIALIPNIFYNYRYNQNSLSLGELHYWHFKAAIRSIKETMSFIHLNQLIQNDIGDLLMGKSYANLSNCMLKFGKDSLKPELIKKHLINAILEILGENGVVVLLPLWNIYLQNLYLHHYFEIKNESLDSFKNFRKANELVDIWISNSTLKFNDGILIYGTGNWGKNFFQILSKKNFNIIAFIDSNIAMHNLELFEKQIISPDSLNKIKFTKILIASSAFRDIIFKLKSLGIEEEKLIYYGFM